MPDFIEIRGASTHNLKNIDVRIPRNQLTVITGVSGSGKSSLAFDTLYEEGKRRYLMFSGAQFRVEHESNFDSITGLSPTVAVEQRVIRQSNPRSTVGSRTKLGNMLAILYATHGKRDAEYDDGLPLPMETFLRNSPKGMCVKCLGTGRYQHIDEDDVFQTEIVIKNVFNGFLVKHRSVRDSFKRFCVLYRVDTNQPIHSMRDDVLTLFKYGCRKSGFVGASVVLNRLQKHIVSKHIRNNIDGNEIDVLGTQVVLGPCPKCSGTGLGEPALHTTISGKIISELENMDIHELAKFLSTHRDANEGGRTLIDEMLVKLQCMADVGLYHLSLSRTVPSLSGGEVQRLFLASYIIADMDSIIFIFDEPTIGLHEVEKAQLIDIIRNLVNRGNTVIAVEHDASFMRAADYIVDLGPAAGLYGGQCIFQGTLPDFLECGASNTAPYLAGHRHLPVKSDYRPIDPKRVLAVKGANTHHLKNISIDIPLGLIVGIAGVSGSGKSSLISYTLAPKLRELLKSRFLSKDDYEEGLENDVQLTGTEHIRTCLVIDQKPIGRSKTSSPATYTGIYDRIRTLFASTPEAVANGYPAGLFSNHSEGGCPACKGNGFTHYHVGFGNFIEMECEECGGAGFVEEALEVTLEGKNIREVLEMSVSEALSFFGSEGTLAYDKSLHSMLKTLEYVGLGYIKLGQQTPTISGGEAQRIKLAKELGKQRGKGNLYILDEPTTGLAFADTERLIRLLQELCDGGNTVLVTEHDGAVLSNCDYIIEMGPGGGRDGGQIIASGTPQDLKNNPYSVIGKFLS